MARIRHLNKAPIVEAVIDIRVKLQPDFDVQNLALLPKEISDQYPSCEPRKLISGSLGIKDGKTINTLEDKGIHGYLCKTSDDKNIVQFKKDGFTFSRLTPYPKWEDIIIETKRLWEKYRSVTSPIIVDRVATRFINRIDLLIPVDLDKYFVAPPKLPKTLPQGINEFFNRVVVSENELTANIIQTTTQGTKPGYGSIILDIDTFSEQVGGIKEEDIWRILGRLRVLKNRIFFGMLKEEMVKELK